MREFAGVPAKVRIERETLVEGDLGITGDDGCESLVEMERRFGIRWDDGERGLGEVLQMEGDEFLFRGEGFDLFGWLRREKVRDVSVGELYEAVRRRSAEQAER